MFASRLMAESSDPIVTVDAIYSDGMRFDPRLCTISTNHSGWPRKDEWNPYVLSHTDAMRGCGKTFINRELSLILKFHDVEDHVGSPDKLIPELIDYRNELPRWRFTDKEPIKWRVLPGYGSFDRVLYSQAYNLPMYPSKKDYQVW